jgi:4-hydroxythreonine-4-phosphate dehydrogenase
MSEAKNIKIGISIGDINGVGMEVILKTFEDRRMLELCTPILFGSARLLNAYKKVIGLDELSFNTIHKVHEAKSRKINLINCWKEDVALNLGKNTSEGGKYAFKSLEAATKELKDGSLDALVTAPINKKNIQSDKFEFPGHTEYLEKQDQGQALMFMLSDSMKIGVVTGHIPIDKVSANISEESILKKLQSLHQSLQQDFGIRKPKIALLGLNPHAGDDGVIGQEDKNIIIPAIQSASDKNILAFGPYPADGFFGSSSMKNFDGILAMYHDQGLIPFKTLSFGKGVNFTAGLSFVRTSPDHGTAYDIAGKNLADHSSFREAIYSACDIFRKRKESLKLQESPLVIKQKKKTTGFN